MAKKAKAIKPVQPKTARFKSISRDNPAPGSRSGIQVRTRVGGQGEEHQQYPDAASEFGYQRTIEDHISNIQTVWTTSLRNLLGPLRGARDLININMRRTLDYHGWDIPIRYDAEGGVYEAMETLIKVGKGDEKVKLNPRIGELDPTTADLLGYAANNETTAGYQEGLGGLRSSSFAKEHTDLFTEGRVARLIAIHGDSFRDPSGMVMNYNRVITNAAAYAGRPKMRARDLFGMTPVGKKVIGAATSQQNIPGNDNRSIFNLAREMARGKPGFAPTTEGESNSTLKLEAMQRATEYSGATDYLAGGMREDGYFQMGPGKWMPTFVPTAVLEFNDRVRKAEAAITASKTKVKGATTDVERLVQIGILEQHKATLQEVLSMRNNDMWGNV